MLTLIQKKKFYSINHKDNGILYLFSFFGYREPVSEVSAPAAIQPGVSYNLPFTILCILVLGVCLHQIWKANKNIKTLHGELTDSIIKLQNLTERVSIKVKDFAINLEKISKDLNIAENALLKEKERVVELERALKEAEKSSAASLVLHSKKCNPLSDLYDPRAAYKNYTISEIKGMVLNPSSPYFSPDIKGKSDEAFLAFWRKKYPKPR